MKRNLDKTPKLLRSATAKGIKSEPNGVEPLGGQYKAGLIKGYAVITRGEALGHGMWIDATFLQSVADAINVAAKGAKSRFTHPGLSGDGLAKFLGRTTNAYVDGDVVRGNEHLAKSAHLTPDGDLAGYILTRAKEDPESFGASIAFEVDRVAMQEYWLANGGEIDEYGNWEGDFKSPDALNTENYPHVRLAELHAVDIVDDPAANPNGLFHRGDEVAREASEYAAYALGLSKDKPTSTTFSIDPERAQGFVSRFLSEHGLKIVKEQPEMATETKPAEPEIKPDEAAPTPVEKPAEETKPVEKSAEAPALAAKTGKDFLAAFGQQGGVWFAEGKSYDEAQTLFHADLQNQLKESKEQLAAAQEQLKAGRGEAEPVKFETRKPAAETKFSGLGDNVSKVAASIKLPTKK